MNFILLSFYYKIFNKSVKEMGNNPTEKYS